MGSYTNSQEGLFTYLPTTIHSTCPPDGSLSEMVILPILPTTYPGLHSTYLPPPFPFKRTTPYLPNYRSEEEEEGAIQ